MKESFRVIQATFNPEAVGKPRMVEVMGKEVNLPQTTSAPGKVYKRGLSKSAAHQLADKLNDQESLKDDLTVMVSYYVRPEPKSIAANV